MQRKISKENITELAHQAVSSLWRLVGTSSEAYTPSQQDLVSTSKLIEERWQRRRLPVDAGTVELWCAGLRDELAYLTSPRSSVEPRKPLPESAMVSALETARILSRTAGRVAAENFATNKILSLIVKYFLTVPLSKKLREVCALVLSEVPGDEWTLMRECLEAALPAITAVCTCKLCEGSRVAEAPAGLLPNSPAPTVDRASVADGEKLQDELHPPKTTAGEKASAAAPSSVMTSAIASDANPATSSADNAAVEPATHVNPCCVHLAALLVSAIHRADAVGLAEGRERDGYSLDSAVSLLDSAYRLMAAGAVTGNGAASSTDAGAGGDSYQITAVVVYLSLLSGLVRGNDQVKRALASEHGQRLCELWTAAASRLSSIDTIICVPTSTVGKDALITLSTGQFWQSELLELLIELATEDSFTYRRLSIYDAVDSNSPTGNGETPNALSRSPSQRQPGSGTLSVSNANAAGVFSFGVRRFEPIPSHWSTILTGGSPLVWRVAAQLPACRIRPESIAILERCLMRLDCSSVLAESMYRSIVTTLMLLCVANPRNAEVLASHAIFECLCALVTHSQSSIFPSEVRLPALGGNSSSDAVEESVQPKGVLSTNMTQLTESFMCSLAAAYFPKKLVQMLMGGVDRMSSGGTCQTDSDVMEALLHVLANTYIPPRVLFFPGGGSVTCKVGGFPGRWSGYSLSAWVNPVCVWAEGSHLFSFAEDGGASVTLMVVANGRSCYLALRVQTPKDLAVCMIPDSILTAETWSHVVFTQALSGVSVFVNGRSLPAPNVNVPFPQTSSKRRLELAFGGAAEEPSFFGYIANMSLSDDAISEKDVARLYATGPGHIDGPDSHSMLTISAAEEPSGSPSSLNPRTPAPASVTGALVGKNSTVSMHGVMTVSVPDMRAVFAECDVMNWSLQTLKASRGAANFNVIAKLCISFLATGMRMTSSDAELNVVLSSGSEGNSDFMQRLKREVLTWEDTFLDFPSIMLAASTPRSGGKALRDHPSTQAVISMLLERLEVVCNARDSATTAAVAGTTSSNVALARNAVSACSILRELSDCLLVEENVRLFKAVPSRFNQVLRMSLYLPPECIDSVVVLVEKLCKRQADLERTLRFLVHTIPGVGSISEEAGTGTTNARSASRSSPNTSLSSLALVSAGVAKAEILRMLFDVARADVAMCDMINACFKGTGSSFLIMLVNGRNHTSEATRVFALRLLSLMLHVNRKFRESFVKSRGFEVLSKAITDPASRVPIRLPTIDCLFQMAFDAYRPTESTDAEMEHRLRSLSSQSPKSKSKRSKQHDNSGGVVAGGVGPSLNLPGHMPGLVSRRLKVTRREYSFEVAHDFARVDDRLRFDDAYRSKGDHSTLRVPPAFETALAVLGCLVRAISMGGGLPAAAGGGGGDDDRPSFFDVGPHTSEEEARRGGWNATGGALAMDAGSPVEDVGSPTALTAGLGANAMSSGDGASSASAKSPGVGEEPLETVVNRVLSYMEKAASVEENGVALLPYPWMDWLWHAVEPVVLARHGNGVAASPSSPAASLRYSKKFHALVMSHTRHIIRRLVVLDMTRNSKATSIRRIRGVQQPPYLLRIVLEEVVRHFVKGRQDEMVDPRGASNVIKNLDALFSNIEYALDPLPLTLGTEIVGSISAIAVRNNSWVRMRMKKDSDLFETRDMLSFFLLVSVKRFAKAAPETLLQLADANANELNTMVVLLYRLTRAVSNKDVDETEMLLLLIRHLATQYEDQMREMYRLLGSSNTRLADLLCVVHEDSRSHLGHQSTSEAPQSSPTGSKSDLRREGDTSSSTAQTADESAPVGSNPLTDHEGSGSQAMMNKLPTSQVIEWCCANPKEWATIAEESRRRTHKFIEARAKGSRDRVEKERSAVSKATRSQLEHREQLKAKVQQEFDRVKADVDAEQKVSHGR